MKHTIASAFIILLIIIPFTSTLTAVSGQESILGGQLQTTLPVGQCIAFILKPVPPPVAPSLIPGDYIFYNVGCEVIGKVSGGPINIFVLDDSNYQLFNKSQACSAFHQQLDVNGSFDISVTFPSNDPDGTYNFFQGPNWWMVFDNLGGSSNASLEIDRNEQSATALFIPNGWIIAAIVGTAIFLVVGSVLVWKRRRAIIRQSSNSLVDF